MLAGPGLSTGCSKLPAAAAASTSISRVPPSPRDEWRTRVAYKMRPLGLFAVVLCAEQYDVDASTGLIVALEQRQGGF